MDYVITERDQIREWIESHIEKTVRLEVNTGESTVTTQGTLRLMKNGEQFMVVAPSAAVSWIEILAVSRIDWSYNTPLISIDL